MAAPSSRSSSARASAKPTRNRGDSGDGSVPQRLVKAATKLFAEQGFESTSVQEIVEAAGVTKGAMYHYFESKDDLLYEIYHRVLGLQMQRLEEIADSDAPLPDRLRAAAVDVVATSVANLDDTVIFFRSIHMLHPDKQKTVRAERRRYHVRFRGLIEEGQRTGLFRDDVPADIIVDYYFGAVHHLGTWYRTGGRLSGRRVGDYFADMLLSGLRGDGQ